MDRAPRDGVNILGSEFLEGDEDAPEPIWDVIIDKSARKIPLQATADMVTKAASLQDATP